jgi:hypothetical protein
MHRSKDGGHEGSAGRKLTQKFPVVTAEGVRVHRTLILVDGRASTVRSGGTFGDGDVAVQVLMRVVYPIGVEVHFFYFVFSCYVLFFRLLRSLHK